MLSSRRGLHVIKGVVCLPLKAWLTCSQRHDLPALEGVAYMHIKAWLMPPYTLSTFTRKRLFHGIVQAYTTILSTLYTS